ncbi:MAG: hypothetical protein K2X93_19750 [Candidatus Obscuribacterales bacterium]|nr:hypothetical protein [Candidatus Obscuribacterales bacterium]
MNYLETIAYIESLSPTLERPTLERMQLFMREQGDFQNKIKTFHVGGTNGKGSTATILDVLVRSLGLKVGRYTGPHILCFNERYSVNGRFISDAQLSRIATEVRILSEKFGEKYPEFGCLTWFELLTAIAFFWFREEEIDCAVLEVGLGGRFDATNVADNILASVITNIDLDHTHILGDTVEKIAFEKAGIIRNGVPVVTYAKGSALEELTQRANEVGANLISLHATDGAVNEDAQIKRIPTVPKAEGSLLLKDGEALRQLSLIGPHQRRNAELAITALCLSNIVANVEDKVSKHLVDTLSGVYFPGRIQVLADRNIILDGAHNPAGALALRKALDERSSASRTFVLGFFGNKDVPAYLRNLLAEGDFVVACQAESRRATYPKEGIVDHCQKLGIEALSADSFADALSIAQARAGEDEIVVTGSFIILKTLMEHLGWNSVEDGRKQFLQTKR